MPDDKHELPRMPIEVLQSTANIVEQISPELLRDLGGIATIGDDGPAREWVHELVDAAQRMSDVLGVIYEAIDQIDTRPSATPAPVDTAGDTPVSEEVKPTPVEPEFVVVPEVEVAQEETVDARKETEGVVAAEDAPRDHIGAVVDVYAVETYAGELSLSPNEQLAMKRALAFLSETEDLQSIRSVISHVFGLSRLNRGEERRLLQIMEGFVERGVLRGYGKSFGYKSLAERQAVTADLQSNLPTGEDVLADAEKELVDFVTSLARVQGNDVNIGQIVREYYRVDRLDPEAFHQTTALLNDLADRGYLIHAPGSPWYGVRPETETQPLQKKVLTSITTPVKQATPVIEHVVEAEAEAPETTPSIFEFTDFSPREQDMIRAILRVAKPNEWYRQRDVDFSEVGFVSDSARRQASSILNAKLVERGLLITEGVVSGKKYMLAGLLEAALSQETEVLAAREEIEAVADAPSEPEEQESTPSDDLDTDQALGLFDVMHFSSREQDMIRAILHAAKPNEWFRQRHIDVDHIHFASHNARRQAFTMLNAKLVESGLLVTEGARGGKKYMLAGLLLDELNRGAEKPEAKIQEETTSTAEDIQEPAGAGQTDTRTQIVARRVARKRAARVAETREQRIAFTEAARFAGSIVTVVTEMLETAPDNKQKVSVVAQELAKLLAVKRDDARELLTQLVEADHFYYNGSQRGSRLLGLNKPEQETEQSAADVKEKTASADEEDQAGLTEYDIEMAANIFGKLLELTHVQQGLTFKDLIKGIGISRDDEAAFKRAARRLETHGYLVIDRNGRIATRSPHSRKLQAPIVRLASQALKERIKSEPNSLLQEMRSRLSDVS